MCSPLFFLLWFKITPKLLKNTFLILKKSLLTAVLLYKITAYNYFLHKIYFSVVSVKFSQSTILIIITYHISHCYSYFRKSVNSRKYCYCPHVVQTVTKLATFIFYINSKEKGTFFRMSPIKSMNYFLNPSFSISARYLSISVFFRYARSPLLCPTILRSPLLEW